MSKKFDSTDSSHKINIEPNLGRTLFMNIDQFVNELIHSLGVVGKYYGSTLLKHCVLLAVENENTLYRVTKDIYPVVAAKFHTKVYNVERNIRTFIDAFWKNGNCQRLNEIVGCPVVHKPTVGGLIEILSSYVQRHYTANS